ncbi:MAG: YceI family protein [Cytophagaceae bacterium]|nr:YceI family protein [Cytophagaceae bacterium]
MKTIVTLFALSLLAGRATAQLFTAQTTETSFFSKAPLEDISAINRKIGVVMNTSTGDIAVKMQMTDFSFPNKLMQEHFNENYLESDKYPTATFRGKIQELIDFTKPGSYPVTVKGTFDLHGVKKERTLPGTVTVQAGKIALTSEFTVALADHRIEIPKLVFQKIAEVISVKNTWALVPYQRQ